MKVVLVFLFVFLFVLLSFSQDTISIFFDLNKKEVSPKFMTLLDSVIQNCLLKNNDDLAIIGYADYLGSREYNISLSKKRAFAVSEVIEKKGIMRNRIRKILGKGEQIELLNDNDQKGNPADRRVDIIYLNTASSRNESSLKKSVDKLKKGETLVFKNLNFEGGRHHLLQDSYTELKKLHDLLIENPKLKIEIQGHICCDVGNADGLDFDTNEPKLSENRAKFVYDYLIKKGIDASRLQYVGFGRSKPIVKDEITEEDRKTNRRVEIKILDK